MAAWFSELASVEDPQREQLVQFLTEVEALLSLLLHDEALLRTLWRGDSRLRGMAHDSFKPDIGPQFTILRQLLGERADQEAGQYGAIGRGLGDHGLIGPSARFKYNVLAKLARSWRTRNGHLTGGSGMRRVLEGVDAVLDSALSVAGAGGAIKEFKDVIAALGTGKGD